MSYQKICKCKIYLNYLFYHNKNGNFNSENNWKSEKIDNYEFIDQIQILFLKRILKT